MKLLVAARNVAFCSKSAVKQTNVTEKMNLKLGGRQKHHKRVSKIEYGDSHSSCGLLFKGTWTRLWTTALLKTTQHQTPSQSKRSQKTQTVLVVPYRRAANPRSK